jgi:hypothetical protein
MSNEPTKKTAWFDKFDNVCGLIKAAPPCQSWFYCSPFDREGDADGPQNLSLDVSSHAAGLRRNTRRAVASKKHGINQR